MRRRRLLVVALAAGLAATTTAGWVVGAEQNAPAMANSAAQPEPQNLPIIQPPPPAAANVLAESANSAEPANAMVSEAGPPKPTPPAPPPAPVLPVRSSAAILQALDKVTAETMRFAVPVGQRIRFKNLVFTVKACETSGVSDPEPQASAYLVVESQPLAIEGQAAPPARIVYKGWMFANSPSLHPLDHPVYDAWLVACMASPPPA